MDAGGKGKTECPGLKGEMGAMCPPGCDEEDEEEAWGSDLLSGRGLLAELALLELALARTWLELANCAPSRADLEESDESFLLLVLPESVAEAWSDIGGVRLEGERAEEEEGEWLCLSGGERDTGEREWGGKGGHETEEPVELPFGILKGLLSEEPFVTITSFLDSPLEEEEDLA